MKRILTLISCYLFATAYGQGGSTALSFDGNDAVVVAHTAALTPANSLTVEAWVFLPSVMAGSQKVVAKFGDVVFNNAYSLEITNGVPVFLIYIEPGAWAGLGALATLAPNQWHHLAAVYDGAVCRLGVNGEFTQVSLPGTITPSTATLRLGSGGAALGGAERLAGTIDEVRIWNRALTQEEIRHKMTERLTGTEPGLVAYYRLDEGADNTCPGGQDVCDASGTGTHGVKF
jgi:hypothetical protein